MKYCLILIMSIFIVSVVLNICSIRAEEALQTGLDQAFRVEKREFELSFLILGKKYIFNYASFFDKTKEFSKHVIEIFPLADYFPFVMLNE